MRHAVALDGAVMEHTPCVSRVTCVPVPVPSAV
jgi:hypothetical protein